MIRALIRTISDSALFLKDSVTTTATTTTSPAGSSPLANNEEGVMRASTPKRDAVSIASSTVSSITRRSWRSLTSLLSASLYLSSKKSSGTSKAFPMEIISLIVSYVAGSSSSKGQDSSLKSLLLVDKRWNACTVLFLWQVLEIESMAQWSIFSSVLTSKVSTHYYGSFIRHLYLRDVTIENSTWVQVTHQLSGVQLLSLEKVLILPPPSSSSTSPTFPVSPTTTSGGGGGGSGSDKGSTTKVKSSLSDDEEGEYLPTMQCLRELVIADCSRSSLYSFLILFQRAPRISKLSITGCDFNEGDLCSLLGFSSRLTDLTLSTLEVASPTATATTSGGGMGERDPLLGGDAFAAALIKCCPRIHSLDLTGNSALTETGFTALLQTFGGNLKKLQLRRLNGLSGLSLASIATYCSQGKLKKLSLSTMSMLNDRILELIMLATSGSLEFLQLDSVNISDKGARSISKHGKGLVQLRMYDLKWLSDVTFLTSGGSGDGGGGEGVSTDKESITLPNLKQLILHGSPELSAPSTREALSTLGSPGLERLELVGCYRLDESTLRAMTHRWSRLTRFIYVGGHASTEFQRELKRRLPACNTTVYAIGPM